MKILRSALFLPLLAASLSSCVRHSGPGHDLVVASAPTFFESEPNDDDFNANDLGILYPGDFFYIDGSITDSGFDPFDGFLFTSGEPIHVDFRLFIDDQLADFDVCLYDPVFDEILAHYATSDNPELGGVDLLDGNVDFHLVVNSFIGSGTYSLEIDVQPLYLREGSSPQAAGKQALIIPRFENPAAQAEADQGIRPRLALESFSGYRR